MAGFVFLLFVEIRIVKVRKDTVSDARKLPHTKKIEK